MDYTNPNDFWKPGDPDLYKGLSDEERIVATICHITGMVLAFFFVLGLCAMCSGCTTTEYVTVEKVRTDTLIQNKVLHDSIYINDSTVITEKGDTVTVERWHTRYVLRELHDTAYISKTDSVPVPYPVETIREVAQPLSWWQQTRLHLANILLMALALCAVVWIGKNHIKRLMP